jgi:hypothetical protein
MEPDNWIVGIIKDDGSYGFLMSDRQVNPSTINEVIFPLSLPWEDEPQLIPVPLEVVEVTERNMGSEKHYSAKAEDRVPNSNSFWEIELELWEYPENTFNMSRLTRTENIRNANWDSDDLVDAMRRRF